VVFSPHGGRYVSRQTSSQDSEGDTEQAEAYRRGTPASRRALLIVLLVIWLAVVATVLLLVFVFHKTLYVGGHI
jgi:t-SNARE complex subunit (syntaxin)